MLHERSAWTSKDHPSRSNGRTMVEPYLSITSKDQVYPSRLSFDQNIFQMLSKSNRRMVDLVNLQTTKDIVYIQTQYRQSTDTSVSYGLCRFERWLFPPNSTVPPTVSPPHVFKSFAGNYLGTKTIITVSNCPHSSYHRLSKFQSILKLFTDTMNSNSCDDSAVSSSGGQHSGIRAAGNSNLRATSTTIPCQHCADEKRGRRWLVKRCYYCNNPGHQVSNCKRKENEEETQLIRHAINTGVQQNDVKNEEHIRSWEPEFIVTGTDGGLWSEFGMSVNL
ncbi:putative transcription factor interactor and regulator CCHC(Zn) family [Helianthus annuus]|nr:putative transcription factor interactor and regulator CCHC(Zn) family [Helianthus annuus]